MDVLKIYNVSTDVAAGSVNMQKLTNELASSGDIQNYGGINLNGDELTVFGDVFNELDVDTLIYNHVPQTLAEAKYEKNEEINDRTEVLIAAGYAYGGMQFSLSLEAQINILGLKEAADLGALTYPVDFNNIDDTAQYQIANGAEVVSIFLTALATKKGILDSGTALKQAVEAATNMTELDAVVDNR